MGKLLPFIRPTHECYKPTKQWGGFVRQVNAPCPACVTQAERKARFRKASAARGHARRSIVEEIP
jgi:hypothetical protein